MSGLVGRGGDAAGEEGGGVRWVVGGGSENVGSAQGKAL